ncbi:MAG TPA: sigma 54-interacting transcriptional regulator [Nitriliruptorales bacterium]|nr:sigma 54-interacting transcriptional regulator [Nitriliruptorales bacterium]
MRPATVAELRAVGYPDRTVKEELRANLITRLQGGRPLLPDVVGFEDSVVPDLERGILAGHDLVLLGERGQAKTRIIRRLADLLDEAAPAVAGCEVNCHPYHPVCSRCRQLLAERGEDLPVAWVGRDQRFSEKLATPDTSVGDLIGDVDPIKVAEGRHLGDELTIHYGLVPRTNRGIFAINELPDLPERIQVALLNVLEERDVQVRGYKLRLPLDLMLVATANPDDYTNRGRIISPLKDRFGTQVRTHYPQRIDQEIAIARQESTTPPPGVDVRVPRFLEEVLAELTRQLRTSSQVNQRSGVSVRYTIGGRETLVAGAVRRAVRAGETEAVPRPVDLWAVVPAALGRVEFDTFEEGREEEIVARLLRHSILTVWRRRLGREQLAPLVARFDRGLMVETGDTMSAVAFLEQFGDRVQGLARLMQRLDVPAESPGAAASALEFALEGLHLAKRLNKEDSGVPGGYRFSAA